VSRPEGAPFVTEREAHRAFIVDYLRRLAHQGGAEAVAAVLPMSADSMVADGLAESADVGPECWALTAEHGRVVLTWPDGQAEHLELPLVDEQVVRGARGVAAVLRHAATYGGAPSRAYLADQRRLTGDERCALAWALRDDAGGPLSAAQCREAAAKLSGLVSEAGP